MNWMTIVWTTVATACVTLGFLQLRIGLVRPVDTARLLFSLSAFANAAEGACELALIHAESPAQFQDFLTWGDIFLGLAVISLTAFIWVYFRSGNKWLALAVPCLWLVALGPDLIPGGVHTVYLEITSVHLVQTYGGAFYHAAVGTPNPWNAIAYLGALTLCVFVVDASLRLARRGNRRRAIVIGGSVVVWMFVTASHSALVEIGAAQLPYVFSLGYLVIVVAMSFELTHDVLVAAQVGRQLQDSERRMELASSAVGLGMWTWDLKRHEGWSSARAQSLFGLPESEQITDERFIDLVHPDDRDMVRRSIERSMTSDEDFEMTIRPAAVSGETRWISVYGRVERDTAGQPILLRGVLRDDSSRRRSELELNSLQSQLAHISRVSAMGQLATALAHELQQPLGAILRNAEAAELFLEHDPPDLDELRAILIDIRADDKRAREVIERLRALLTRRSIEKRTLAVADVFTKIAALTHADADARGINVQISSALGLPQIMGDAVHLQQVLINLVLNAMDAIGSANTKERLIEVRAEYRDGRDVEVMVCDTGPGIAPGNLGLIFDPFYTTKASGMGIGLSVSRTIIEAHGGRIWAENNVANGATFHITLPTEDTVSL